MWGGTSTQKSLSSVAQDLRHLGIQRIHWVGGGGIYALGKGLRSHTIWQVEVGTTVGYGKNTMTEMPVP